MFSFLQGSRDKSVPIHLYEVVYGVGSTNRIRLTDAEEPVVVEGNTYQVAQIKHGEIHASGNLDKSELDVTTRYDSPLAELFRHYPPSQVVYLTIYRGEANDPAQEFYAIWSGRILSCNIEVYEAKLTCEPIGTAVRRPGLRRNFQITCPHVLYGPSCRADRNLFSVNTTVRAMSGASIRVEGAWHGSWAPGQFLNGMAEWEDSRGNIITRTILQMTAASGSHSLLLAGALAGLRVGMPVRLSLGCNHQLSNCTDVFQNTPNYGGCPWIPTKNPVGSYNPFY